MHKIEPEESNGKQSKTHSLVLGALTVTLAIVGFFCSHTLAQIEESIKDLRNTIMPRHEIELQIAGIKEHQLTYERDLAVLKTDLADLRIRVGQIELGRKAAVAQ